MPLTALQLVDLRMEIGTADPPTDAELNTIFDRRGGLVGVAREIWRTRYADLLNTPASFAIPGDYSQSTGENLQWIAKRLATYEGLDDTSNDLPPLAGAVVKVGYLHRANERDQAVSDWA